ncbi:hypothetical protein AWC38_SpisGene6301, partial [Stylophora pistillata]
MTRRNVVIVGDFNSDMLYRTCNGTKLNRIFQSFNFWNIIKVPTRTSEHSNTLIDLILTNNISKVSSSDVINYCIADHKFTYVVYKLKTRDPKPFVKYVQNFKNVMKNPNDLKHDLESAPWWVCSTFDDIDDITWAWDCMYNDIVKGHVTLRKAKVRKCSLPWMNGEISKEINKRYKLLKGGDGISSTQKTWADYKAARNKRRKQQRNLLRDANNNEVSNDNEKVDLINSYFINIGKELAEKFLETDEKCQFVYRITPTIQDLEVYINKLKSDLKNLKPNKASGPDGISSRNFAVAGSSASDGLLMVFYYSMASSSFTDP